MTIVDVFRVRMTIVGALGMTIDRVLGFYLDHPELDSGHPELDSGSQET